MQTYTEEEVIKLCKAAEKRGALWAWELVAKSGKPWSQHLAARIKAFADTLG